MVLFYYNFRVVFFVVGVLWKFLCLIEEYCGLVDSVKLVFNDINKELELIVLVSF